MAITTIIFLASVPSFALDIPCTKIDAGLPSTATIPGAPGTWIEVKFDGIRVDVDDYSKRYGLITTTELKKQSKDVLASLLKAKSDRAIFSTVHYQVKTMCSGGKETEMNPGDTVGCGESESAVIELDQPFCKTPSGNDRYGVFTVTRHTKSSLVDEDIKITVPMPLDVGVKDKLLDSKGSALLTGGILGSDGQLL